VALKTVMEKLRGLRYKLRMMGFQIDGPTYAFGDNMSVVKNTSAPESVLRNKCKYATMLSVRQLPLVSSLLRIYLEFLTPLIS
jgi:hypothetical protein